MVVDERVVKPTNTLQYLIKWEGYGEADNTWEDRDNLFCNLLIEEFKQRKEKNLPHTKEGNTLLKSSKSAKRNKNAEGEGVIEKTPHTTPTKTPKKSKPEEVKNGEEVVTTNEEDTTNGKSVLKIDEERKVGFPYGDVIDEIIGGRMIGGELNLYISWKDSGKRTFVPSWIVNMQAPQTVIAFYESRLKFDNEEEKLDYVPPITSLGNEATD